MEVLANDVFVGKSETHGRNSNSNDIICAAAEEHEQHRERISAKKKAFHIEDYVQYGSAQVILSRLDESESQRLMLPLYRVHPLSHTRSRVKLLQLLVGLNKRMYTVNKPLASDSTKLYQMARISFSQTTEIYLAFVTIAFLAVLMETVVIVTGGRYSALQGWDVHQNTLKLGFENYLLLISTALCMLDVVFVMIFMPGALVDEQYKITRHLNPMEKLYNSVGNETRFEVFFLGVGWVCIYFYSSLAVFRCFRLLRFLWYFELLEVADDDLLNLLVVKPCRQAVTFIESIGKELFSSRNRGSPVLMFLFLYISYIFGVVFWLETRSIDLNSKSSHCESIHNCMFTFMRLAFLDQYGLDFVRIIMDADVAKSKFRILAAILFIYVCVSTIVILYGIIGLIRSVVMTLEKNRLRFEEVSEDAEMMQEQKDEKEHLHHVQRAINEYQKRFNEYLGNVDTRLAEIKTSIELLNGSESKYD